jgi:hypothetical protein
VYEELLKTDLVRLAAQAGLPTHGTRKDLVDRLAELPTAPEPETEPGSEPGSEPPAGERLPIPDDWPADLPPPDLEPPRPAPPLHPEAVYTPEDGVFAGPGPRPMSRQRLCTVTYTVAGRNKVQGGHLLNPINVELRERALARARAAGVNAHAPRLRSWSATSDTSGTAVYEMIIKGR